jgi:hypothetical protein
MNQDLIRLRPFFELVDRGKLDLPDDAQKLRTAHAHLTTEIGNKPEPADFRREAHDRIREAALAGQPLDDTETLADAMFLNTAALTEREIAGQVVEQLEFMLAQSLSLNAVEIIAERLRPLHSSVIAKATSHLEALHYELDAAKLLHSSDKLRSARRDLDGLVKDYAQVRRCWDAVSAFDPSGLDRSNVFGEFRNGDRLLEWTKTVLPVSGFTNNDTPLATEPLARLAQSIQEGFEPWCPTGADRDERHAEVYVIDAVDILAVAR